MGIDSIAERFGAPSVRMSLVVLVVGCILPLACVAAFLIFNFYQYEQAKLTSDAISRARALVATVDRDFAATQSALQALGTSRGLARGDLAGFHARASEALHNIHADSIVVVDPDGQLLLSTRKPFGQPLPKLTSAPLLKRVLETGRPAVSDLYLGPLVGRPIYTVAVPIQHAGAGMLLLCATAAPSQLVTILTAQDLPDSWRGAIIDGTGSVVARTHDMERLLGKQVNPDLLRRISIGDEGGFETRTLDGVPVITVYSRSPVTKWAVVLGMPLSELTVGLRQTLIWLIFASIAAMAAGLALSWFICEKISGSIGALIEQARAIGSGELAPIPHLSFREANVLGRALCAAATNLRQSRIGLRERDQWLALTAEAVHLGIWVRDLARDKIWVSDQWRVLFGFSGAQQVEPADILRRIHADDRGAANWTLACVFGGAGEQEAEYRVVQPDGGLRWISSRGSVEFDDAGRPLLARGVALDITARKRAELELQQKQEQVTHLSRAAMLGELSGALAHELNQPLTAILSNAQAALRLLSNDHAELDEVRDILRDIVDEDKRASEVIRGLRRLFEKRETTRQSMDLNQLAVDVVRVLRNDLINRGVAIKIDLAPAAVLVRADPVQLQQVLINLVLNASDASAPPSASDGPIIIRVALTDGASAQLSVIDQGAGIPAADLERVFEPFYSTKERGMGLGLSICRTIVVANGGRLWGENNARRGASFHVRMPLRGGQGA